jgi:Asp-tRNA(Asn)/Glu-tRNA(Gln) amidotransferase A subunit family amidase
MYKRLFITLAVIMILSTGCSNQSKKDMDFQIEEATITSIHSAFSAGGLTSSELVKMYIERIERYDQPTGLNSIVILNPDAVNDALHLDSLYLATGKMLPLYGIPVIVKDNMDTRGLQTASGSAAMRGFEPVEDAFIVKRLRDAGAIILAKSNMAEWAFSPMVTISSIAGETLNPYNLERVPAGSSGGTAASVAANFGTVGLGSDTGNSIRGPSSHNALVGFRTTIGLVSRGGISPLYLRNDVAGPMTRTVEDAVRILDVIAGYDPADPITINSKGKIPDSYLEYLNRDGLKGARIGVLRELTDGKIDPEIEILFNNALADIEKMGATVVDPIVIPNFEELAAGHWASAFQFDLNNYLKNEPGSPVNSLEEIIAAGNYSQYIESRLLYHFEHTQDPEKNSPPALDAYNDQGRIKFRNAIEEVMDQQNLDAIVYPSWNYKPARVGHFEEYLGDNSQIIAPHTGQPAFTVPMGFTSGDLPAGLQFLGRMFDEPKLIQLVYSFEQQTGHRKSPILFSENPE